jgi:hypothetical protein
MTGIAARSSRCDKAATQAVDPVAQLDRALAF